LHELKKTAARRTAANAARIFLFITGKVQFRCFD
jgi:hypothetical protein